MPSLGVNPFEFLDEFFIPKTRILVLSVGEDFVILACVVFEDLLAENCEFFPTPSHLMPSLGVNPFEFLDEFFIPKTRILVLSVGEDFVILACVVFTQCQRVTDGRTDRHPDRS